MSLITELKKFVNLIKEKKIEAYYFSATLASLISLTPIARKIGFFYFFIFALLTFIMVEMRRKDYQELPWPDAWETVLALGIISLSFAWNMASERMFGAEGFGQTDFCILLAGIFLLFFGISNYRKIWQPLAIVFGSRFSLALLSLLYHYYFIQISGLFVRIVVGIMSGIGYPVISGRPATPGSPANAFTVYGINETSTAVVDWGCTGLPSLLLFSFVLASIIINLRIGRKEKIIWTTFGVLGAFITNIVRMIMLALIMYYYDLKTMLWVHSHIGDFLFVLWVAIFWLLMPHEKVSVITEA
ncbi:MAG: hypothetical protein DRN20_05035 [Thermoplasmata archaeon]|nr:MAG: hypothetical protein DRN20_05035 [Thermoplasmata archaeon]